MIERKIVIGLIVSTDFTRKIRPVWDPMLLESNAARLIARWAVDYFDKYNKAINTEIETVFYKRVKDGMDEDLAEEIEEDILPGLSKEYTSKKFNSQSILDDTIEYLRERQLQALSDQINNILGSAKPQEQRIKEAEDLQRNYRPIELNEEESIDLTDEKVLERIDKAFAETADPIVKFPKQLGEFWNDKFVPGGFISLLAPEKRGKTFWLLEIGMRTLKEGKNVAFFQAGDMNEGEQLKRIGIYLLKRNTLEKYCGEHFQPVRDCIKNQDDTCSKNDRACDFTPFDDDQIFNINRITKEELVDAYEMYSDYKPCFDCLDYKKNKWGVPWIQKIDQVDPIDAEEVKEYVKKEFIGKTKGFKLSTHPNGTLSINIIEQKLKKWKDDEGFVPDEILIDYWELLFAKGKDERERQNNIGKDLRKLSQTPIDGVLPLVIAPTQADSLSYKSKRLDSSNFSEDKRKFGHVTAMYGLNQDPEGREKRIGLMRINEIVMREGDFDNANEVVVMQDLWQGRPFIGSFYKY
jgi:hypothetical protein